MTRAPYVLQKDERPYQHRDRTMFFDLDRVATVNPAMPAEHTIAMGEGAEILAEKYSISRARQDEFALASHHKAHAAWQSGRLAAETVPGPYDLSQDESIRPGGDLETLQAAAAGIPAAARRHGHRGQLLAAERRRRRGSARQRAGRARVRTGTARADHRERWHRA